jgi:hypothetical protein
VLSGHEQMKLGVVNPNNIRSRPATTDQASEDDDDDDTDDELETPILVREGEILAEPVMMREPPPSP